MVGQKRQHHDIKRSTRKLYAEWTLNQERELECLLNTTPKTKSLNNVVDRNIEKENVIKS
jgi:hypothetical protein